MGCGDGPAKKGEGSLLISRARATRALRRASLDVRSQGANLLALQGMENEETARWSRLHRRGRSKLPRLPKGEKNTLNEETPTNEETPRVT